MFEILVFGMMFFFCVVGVWLIVVIKMGWFVLGMYIIIGVVIGFVLVIVGVSLI